MYFNSVSFLFFLIIVFLIHWQFFSKTKEKQNIFLFFSSLVFYSFWDYRFTLLLLVNICIGFYFGNLLGQIENKVKKKNVLYIGIFFQLVILFFFKYCNFFIENLHNLIISLGLKSDITLLKIILPVGISFYTFHGLSYMIDIYNGRIESRKSIIDYGLFVSFFPLLVSGPIERATHLLPQLETKRDFKYSYAVRGLKQILWGLVKKIIIADSCGQYVDIIFNDYQNHNGSTLLLGLFLFSFQIYGDFSGYTDIALGVARLFGIELLQNFSYPYFSRSITEFWRRWHISLSSWFRDYLYIPLGGSRVSKILNFRNIFIVFIVSGFWHGADWKFIIWGGLNAIYLIVNLIVAKKQNDFSVISKLNLKYFFQIVLIFILISVGRVFFRSESIYVALDILNKIFSFSFFELPQVLPLQTFSLLFLFISIEWVGRFDNFAIEKMTLKWNKTLKYSFYYLLVLMIMYYHGKNFQFIYFQF